MAVKIKGLDKAVRNIKKTLTKQLKDKTLLNAIGEEAVLAIQNDTFKGKSSITGKRFKRYSKSYKETIKGKASFRKNKQGKTYPIKPALTEDLAKYASKNASRPNLFVSGQLLKALTHKVDKNTVEIFTKNSSRGDTHLTNAEISELITKGTTGKTKMPARPYIGITQKTLKKITNRIKRFFK